ncbi:MAG: flagellar basal body rod protein FlgC [Verrucomicrobiota bacterium]
MNLIPGALSASQGLQAEQLRMEVISQNVANARTTRTTAGGPYQRQAVRFSEALGEALSPSPTGSAGASDSVSSALSRAEIVPDNRPPIRVHQPGHPDADAEGYVSYPAINVHEEMADLISASRTYEANLAVIRNGRALAQQALSIGRRS